MTAELSVAISDSLQVSMKLADRRSFAGPRIEKNLLKVLMKLSGPGLLLSVSSALFGSNSLMGHHLFDGYSWI